MEEISIFFFCYLLLSFQQNRHKTIIHLKLFMWAPQVDLMVKNLPANAGDVGLIPGLERYSVEGNGNPIQYSCLENPMDRGAWWGCKELDTTEAT